MGKPIIWFGANAKLINSGDLLDRNDNSLTNGGKITITQASHGFTSSDIGRPLYLNGTTWTLAQADTAAKAEVAGFIYSVIDANTLLILLGGEIPAVGANFLEGGGSLTAGTVYFLSPTTAGKVTATEPTTTGLISKPLGIAETTTGFIATKFRNSFVVNSNPQNELNVVTNPLALLNTTGWSASGLTLTRDATGSPLDPVVPTGFNLSASATSQTFTSSALTVPSTLRNKKLKLEFYYSYTSGSSFTVDVLDGSDVQYALTTDSSGTTTLAQMTGKFVCYFDSNNTSTCKVKLTSTGSGAMKITQIIVGPGIQPQGAVVGEWQSFTPTGTWTTNTTYTGRYRRVGDSMDFEVKIALAGAPTATALYVDMPLGLTLDTTKIQESSNGNILGSTYILDAGVKDYLGPVVYLSATQVRPQYADDAAAGVGPLQVTQAAPITFGSGDAIIIRVDNVPISQWSGSGTVQLAQNDVEYAYNTDASSTAIVTNTGFAYGPSGVAFGSNWAVGTLYTRRVRFQTPIQAGDRLTIEVSLNNGGNNTWYPLNEIIGASMPTGSTYSYGYRFANVASNSTDIDVEFQNGGARPGGTFGTATGTAWTSYTVFNWRVRKSSAGAAVGFGIVSPGVSSGLVSASGLPGNTTGNAIAAGYVGEEILSVQANANWTAGSTNYGDVTTITLTAGVWKINGCIGILRNSVTFSAIELRGYYTSTAGNSVTGVVNNVTAIYADAAYPTTFTFIPLVMPEITVISNGTNLVIKDGSNTTYTSTQILRLKLDIGFYASGTPQVGGFLRAIRIA